MIEVWKDIPGFDGKYQVNTEGCVARVLPSGERRMLKPIRKGSKQDRKYYVFLYHNKKRYERSILHIVSRTFLGEPPKGCVAYYKNGCSSDFYLNNVGYIKRSEYNKKNGRKGCKSVCKIDKNGEIVDFYPSITKAAQENNYSFSGMRRRLKLKTENPFNLDGYAYFYEENDHGLKIFMNKIKKGQFND